MRASDAGSRSGEAISTLTSRILHPPGWQQNRRFAENCVTCGRRECDVCTCAADSGLWALASSVLGSRLSGLGSRPRFCLSALVSVINLRLARSPNRWACGRSASRRRLGTGIQRRRWGPSTLFFARQGVANRFLLHRIAFHAQHQDARESRARSTRLCREWPWSWLDARPVRSPEKIQFNCLRPACNSSTPRL